MGHLAHRALQAARLASSTRIRCWASKTWDSKTSRSVQRFTSAAIWSAVSLRPIMVHTIIEPFTNAGHAIISSACFLHTVNVLHSHLLQVVSSCSKAGRCNRQTTMRLARVLHRLDPWHSRPAARLRSMRSLVPLGNAVSHESQSTLSVESTPESFDSLAMTMTLVANGPL